MIFITWRFKMMATKKSGPNCSVFQQFRFVMLRESWKKQIKNRKFWLIYFQKRGAGETERRRIWGRNWRWDRFQNFMPTFACTYTQYFQAELVFIYIYVSHMACVWLSDISIIWLGPNPKTHGLMPLFELGSLGNPVLNFNPSHHGLKVSWCSLNTISFQW